MTIPSMLDTSFQHMVVIYGSGLMLDVKPHQDPKWRFCGITFGKECILKGNWFRGSMKGHNSRSRVQISGVTSKLVARIWASSLETIFKFIEKCRLCTKRRPITIYLVIDKEGKQD